MEEFSKICEVQSDKAAVEISSRYEGTILKLHYKIGDIAKVGTPLVDIETEGEDGVEVAAPVAEKQALQPQTAAPASSTPQHTNAGSAKQLSGDVSLVFAAPAVRRVAREHNVDLKLVRGSGPQGRVLKGDVLSFLKSPEAASGKTVACECICQS